MSSENLILIERIAFSGLLIICEGAFIGFLILYPLIKTIRKTLWRMTKKREQIKKAREDKLPIIPQEGEPYYFYHYVDKEIQKSYFTKSSMRDITYSKLGFCYLTKEKADANIQKVITFYEGGQTNE